MLCHATLVIGSLNRKTASSSVSTISGWVTVSPVMSIFSSQLFTSAVLARAGVVRCDGEIYAGTLNRRRYRSAEFVMRRLDGTKSVLSTIHICIAYLPDFANPSPFITPAPDILCRPTSFLMGSMSVSPLGTL